MPPCRLRAETHSSGNQADTLWRGFWHPPKTYVRGSGGAGCSGLEEPLGRAVPAEAHAGPWTPRRFHP